MSLFDVGMMDQWSTPEPYTLTHNTCLAYAQATNDNNPLYARAEAVPPLVAVLPGWSSFHNTAVTCAADEIALSVVHGQQDMVMYQPLRVGQELLSSSGLVGLHGKSSGTVMVIGTRLTDAASGTLMTELHYTLFYRGAPFDESLGVAFASRAGQPDAPELPAVSSSVDADQTFRYADASGDRMPIHLDNAAAVELGLPGIIVHGLCTLAMACRDVVSRLSPNADPRELKRFGARMNQPLLPNQTITTALRGNPVFATFQTLDSSGSAVLSNGYAELGTFHD